MARRKAKIKNVNSVRIGAMSGMFASVIFIATLHPILFSYLGMIVITIYAPGCVLLTFSGACVGGCISNACERREKEEKKKRNEKINKKELIKFRKIGCALAMKGVYVDLVGEIIKFIKFDEKGKFAINASKEMLNGANLFSFIFDITKFKEYVLIDIEKLNIMRDRSIKDDKESSDDGEMELEIDTESTIQPNSNTGYLDASANMPDVEIGISPASLQFSRAMPEPGISLRISDITPRSPVRSNSSPASMDRCKSYPPY